MFFPDIASQEDAERIARSVVLAASQPFEISSHTVDVGASVGVAISPDHGASIESLMRAADVAMYRAKSLGGGQFSFFDTSLAAEHEERVETERALAEALQRDEFVLAFQPQMSLVTGELCGAEALIRWNHPREGLRMPSRFIPVAERTGIIADIGEWVISEVAATLATWKGNGFSGRIGFNVSPRQLERPDFFVKLRQALADADVPLSMVELEFTESAAMDVSDTVLDEISALRADGASVAIDDFGTGYSNIARLRTMPLDRVKLDQKLIADIDCDEKARVIVQAVIHLIKGVGCEIVAEAVETIAQADILRAMGCDAVQGYIFAPAMLEDDFLDWTAGARDQSAFAVGRLRLGSNSLLVHYWRARDDDLRPIRYVPAGRLRMLVAPAPRRGKAGPHPGYWPRQACVRRLSRLRGTWVPDHSRRPSLAPHREIARTI